jgi:adenylate cyclase
MALRQQQISELINWILQNATVQDDLGDLLAHLCERLVAAEIPIWRASLDLPTIDPDARAMMHKWWRDRPVVVQTLSHGPDQVEVFQRSVIYHLISRDLDKRRWRLEWGEGASEFELLGTLQASGATDYLIWLVKFGSDPARLRGVAISIATDRAGGFTDEEIASVDQLVPAIGLAAYRVSADHTAANALEIYLGRNTARRVLAGEIRRGEGERLAAAILFADLRRFTQVSEQEDALKVVGWLNQHFEVVGDAVTAEGGEILKFMGDGLLAVFPVAEADGSPCRGCEAALRAAERAVAANEVLNRSRAGRGEPMLPVDVALNFGEVVYGNVGASRRLDFTVIGRAVNETCRMEALCDDLGRSIVLSEVFAKRCSRPTVMVGNFELRGIDRPRAVYTTLRA